MLLNNLDSNAWFATCPKGVEALLATELATLGAASTRETVAGVHFTGPRALAYRACLWSRLANRILWPLALIFCAFTLLFISTHLVALKNEVRERKIRAERLKSVGKR